jgi:hypothetical protein
MSAESNINIRYASAKDAALLADLGKQAFNEPNASLMPKADLAAYLTKA